MDLNFALYLNLAFFGILGLSILIGLARGFKKSLYAFITMLIFYVVFFLTVDAVVGSLWTMEISQLGTWLSEGLAEPAFAGATSFANAIPLLITTYSEGAINPSMLSPDVITLIGGLGIFVLKIAYTVVYFTVILFVYKILVGIIRMIFFGSRKGETKNPLFGAIFGLANGILALFMLLIISGGVMSVAESIAVLAPADPGAEPLSLSMPRQEIYEAGSSIIPLAGEQPANEDLFAILQTVVEAYNTNILVQAAGVITIPNEAGTLQVPLNLYLFDQIVSFNFETHKVALRNELAVFAAAGKIIMDSEFSVDGDLAKLQGDEIRDIFDLLAASDFLVSAMPLAIEVAANYYTVELNVTDEQLRAIDWHSELLQVGSIAGSMLDILNAQEEGSTTITVSGDDIRELFGSLGDSQLALLASEAFLEPWLSDPDNQATAFLTIPANLDWETEFPAIGNALGAIFDDTSSFVLADLGLTAIYNMSDTTIGLIFESRILVATISTVLTSQDLGGTTLVIPDSAFDEEGYLTQTELTALARAIKLVVVSTTCDPGDTGCESTSFDPAKVLTLSEANIDTLLSSEIIAATMGKLIYDMGTEQTTLVLPDAVKSTVLVNELAVEVVNAAEIKAVFMALMTINVATFDTIAFDAGIIGQLESDSVPGTLDDAKLDTLFASQILHATLSKMLLDLTEGTDAVLTVPELGPDGSVIVSTVGSVDFVSVAELKAALNAMFAIGTTDFQTLGVISADLILSNVAILLDSAILHATISDLMLTGTGGVLIIPDEDDLSNPIRIEQGTVTYISEDEILAIVDALDALGLTDFANVELSPATIFAADYATILDSATMRATFSDTILAVASDETAAVGTATLIVPNALRDDLVVHGITTPNGQIQKAELIAMLHSLEILGITGFDEAFSPTAIAAMEGPAILELLESGSIHATLNNMAKGNANIDTFIPDLAYVTLYGINEMIVDTEIRDFILAANAIAGGAADFTDIAISYTSIIALDAGDLGVALNSMIVRNTITPDLVDAVDTYNDIPAFLGGPNPVQYDPIPNTMYESNNYANFLTKASILTLIDYLPL